MKPRRWLYLTHRWLGIALCLLMAKWFFSGVVMMYVGFPELTRAERLAGLPPLDHRTLRVGPNGLLSRLNPARSVEELRLTSALGRPAWLLRTGDGNLHGQFADAGELFAVFDADDAQSAARSFATTRGSHNPAYGGLLTMDQWSVSSGLHPHRPLHLVVLGDPAGTELYVSSVTGEVVLDTTTNERMWNWMGANLHWIYPFQLRRHATVWHWLIVVLSIAGLVSIVTGIIAGLWRLRIRRPYRGTDVTPYRGTMKLHHILGLFILVPLITYMLSGLLSMNPWGVFSDGTPFGDQLTAYRGNPTIADIGVDIATLRQRLHSNPDTREIHWQWVDGTPYHYSVGGDGSRRLLSPPDGEVPAEAGLALVREVMAGHGVARIERIDAYDSYYYSHHQRWQPLPVLRVVFDDPAASWFHIDLSSGELVNRMTTKGRAERWLYHGLHSLDFQVLIANRPLWDLVVISLSVAGFLFSTSAVIVAWRRLRPRRRRRRAI